jgi:succinate dehydrogenase / fumarate reductase cytochrome b subunit
MGFTGIFLILFLIVHAGLNATIFANDGGLMFNKAGHFMGSNAVPRILEIGLFLGIFLHIYQGYLLTLENKSKRVYFLMGSDKVSHNVPAATRLLRTS